MRLLTNAVWTDWEALQLWVFGVKGGSATQYERVGLYLVSDAFQRCDHSGP
mgnify:CR=1 FL=1